MYLVFLWACFQATAADICFTIPNAQAIAFQDELLEQGGCQVVGSSCQLNSGVVGENVPTPVPTLQPKADFAKAVLKRMVVEWYARRKAEKASNAAGPAAQATATKDLE